jgi:putative restriction endonuclease
VTSDPENQDHAIRLAAFRFLDQRIRAGGEVIRREVLAQGFVFEGVRVRLMGPQGIFKPAIMTTGIPISITTVPPSTRKPRPYEDELIGDLLQYKYRGDDPLHPDNVGLRRAMRAASPLIYFSGVTPSHYLAHWPVFVVADDPATLCFTIAIDDPQIASLPGTDLVHGEARRLYITRLARQRIHQAAFREQVLTAYQRACAMCHLRHEELLDAAHILPDSHPLGEPIVTNGLALCKLHHAAFDAHIVGIRPDLVLRVREDILVEVDGPMLAHGLQGLEGVRITVPSRLALRPNPEFLATRYETFCQAS